MSVRPRPGEIQPGFQQADRFTKTARTLGFNIKAYAELLANDSAEALKETDSPARGTSLAEEWPLAASTIVENVFLGAAKFALERPLGAELQGDAKAYMDAMLVGSKHHMKDLTAVYGQQDPRTGFALDLVAWTEGMDSRGWPLIVDLGLDETHRVAVGVYKDTEAMRSNFDRRVAAAPEKGQTPPRWLSPRVLMVGQLPELDHLSAQISA